MRVSYTKEFLTDYIENNLMINLYAELNKIECIFKQLKFTYDRAGFFERCKIPNPYDVWDCVHERCVLAGIKDKIEMVKALLKTVKNANALNPIVLETKEINLLRL